ncbi:MAG: CGNR zinc finger domain-containing protein [Tetrasphaera sp.]
MGQQVTTKDGRTWFFDPAALFLDVVYTGDLETDDPWWEQWHTPADLDEWVAAHLDAPVRPAASIDLRRARKLRLTLSHIVMALSRAESVAPEHYHALAQEAARPDIPPILPAIAAPPATVAQALATIARDAVRHLAAHPERLKVCAAHDCPLVFLDTSRAGTRTWCSMARCGNRAKARTHRNTHAEGRPA